MRRLLFLICGVVILTGVVLFVLYISRDSFRSLEDAEEFVLFSIEGGPMEQVDFAGERFHEFPVLGKIRIDEIERRRALLQALEDGISRRPKLGAKCFWPRHGIRAVANGKVTEFVICFECSRIHEFVDGQESRLGLINGDVQPSFDSPLIHANVPLSPRLFK